MGIAIPRTMSLYQKAKRRAQTLAIQKQCMNFALPADQVVYEEDHDRAQRLWDSNALGGEFSGLQDPKGKVLAFYAMPTLIGQFVDWDGPGRVLDPFSEFLFMHARRAKGGQERLVHIGIDRVFTLRATTDGGLPPDERDVLDWEVIRPCTRFGAPSTLLANGTWGNHLFHINMPKPLRIYAGQIDPADGSHFTIQATTPQGTLTIDGWLQANDQISFSVK